VEGLKVDASVNLFLATSIWAAVGHSGLPPAINQIEPQSIADTIAVIANWTTIKCQGDFPTSSTRRYAEANQDGHYTESHGTEGPIFLAESEYPGAKVCPIWELSGGIKKGTLNFVSCSPDGLNIQVHH
jgi:hypothetical protein